MMRCSSALTGWALACAAALASAGCSGCGAADPASEASTSLGVATASAPAVLPLRRPLGAPAAAPGTTSGSTSGTAPDAAAAPSPSPGPGAGLVPPRAHFVLVGDTGTATSAQLAVADAIGARCKAERCDALLHLGDVIYERGIASADDPQLESKFLAPFRRIGAVPIWLTLGNHDHYGNPTAWLDAFGPQGSQHGKGVEVHYPAPWWTRVHGGVRVVALDTELLGDAQGRWLDAVLAESQARGERWVVAIGHHPWRSYGMHGHASSGRDAWYRQHLCGRVDLWITGHDHDKQLLASRCDVGLIIAGSGAKQRPVGKGPETLFATQTLGFAMLRIEDAVATVAFFDTAGKVEYQARYERTPPVP